MARTIAVIQASIVAAKNADPALDGLTSTSAVAVWLAWTYVVATAMWVMESLYDGLVSQVNGILATQKPHTLQWYATMAQAFQYGISLPADTDVYAVVPPADLSVLVVNYAAAVETAGQVRIKVATLSAGVLAPLSSPELTAFSTYMNRVKDAGVLLTCTSGNPDTLQLKVTVYYDPLVLNATGERIDGTENTPVLDGINTFLDNLPFNGVFMLNSLIASGQAISGVQIFEVQTAQGTFTGGPTVNILTATPNIYTPDAGYMTLDETYFNAYVTYVPYQG